MSGTTSDAIDTIAEAVATDCDLALDVMTALNQFRNSAHTQRKLGIDRLATIAALQEAIRDELAAPIIRALGLAPEPIASRRANPKEAA